MSHFSLAVIHNEEENIEDLLAPFYEGTEDKQYLEFDDREEEELNKYNSENREMLRSKEGHLESPYDDIFKNPDYEFSKPSKDGVNERFLIPKGWEKVEIPLKEIHPTFDEYMQNWCGYDKRDKEQGRYGYWNNPNARWDWYQIGGRWSDLLKIKDGMPVFMSGEPSALDDKHIHKEGWGDSARLQNIDFAFMDKQSKEQAQKYWNEAMQKLNAYKSENPNASHEEAVKGSGIWMHYDISPTDTEDSYMARAGSFYTYSMLVDGEWMEAGKMGWWGMSNAEEGEKEQWRGEFQKIITKLVKERPESILTIVDCHI